MKIRNTRRGTTGLTAALLASAMVLTACGGGEDTTVAASEDSVASSIDLSGVNISVGSKEYPETVIMGQMLVQSLEAAGATVTDNTGLAGTAVAREALETGEIDVYYEYTGTAWLTILQQTEPIDDAEELFEAVRAADEENDISWFARAPFNNTYALGATAEAAESTGVSTLSDFAELVQENPEEVTLCASAEFSTREDGLPGLEQHYGFTMSQSSVFPVEQTVVYEAVARGECNFLYLVSTDARIAEEGVVVLEDDKSFFPVYNPSVTMRSEVYAEHEEDYNTLFEAIGDLLTQETIIELNGLVELQGLPADRVAQDFLEQQKII